MNIQYKLNLKLTTDEFINILNRSTLGERRPIDDKECIDDMIENADIIVLAIDSDKIVGVARAVTDYNYCCYLSDLAMEQKYQKNVIEKQLISKVQEQLNDKCKIILLSALDATEYYPKIRFTKHSSAWILTRDKKLI